MRFPEQWLSLRHALSIFLKREDAASLIPLATVLCYLCHLQPFEQCCDGLNYAPPPTKEKSFTSPTSVDMTLFGNQGLCRWSKEHDVIKAGLNPVGLRPYQKGEIWMQRQTYPEGR